MYRRTASGSGTAENDFENCLEIHNNNNNTKVRARMRYEAQNKASITPLDFNDPNLIKKMNQQKDIILFGNTFISKNWIRLLLALLFIETLYILSREMMNSMKYEELHLNLKLLESDLQKSQLVIKTLTLSVDNTNEIEECNKNAENLKKKYLEYKKSSSRRNNNLRIEIDKYKEILSDLKQKAHQALLPAPPSLVLASGVQPAAGSNANDDPNPWLVIGIPTIVREENVEYLTETLNALISKLPSLPNDPLFDKIRIVVMNNEPGKHESFSLNRKRLENSQWADYFDFIDNVNRQTETKQEAFDTAKAYYRKFYDDHEEQKLELNRKMNLSIDKINETKPKANIINDSNNDNNTVEIIKKKKQSERRRPQRRRPQRSNSRVQQQTRDVVDLLNYVYDVHKPTYYLFMEDDFKLCSNGIEAIRYLIQRATYYNHDWIAIRASFGLNGIFLHGNDIQVVSNYLYKHQVRRPPDHLLTEWFAGETKEAAHYRRTRKHVGFRFNIFEHIGVVSSIRKKDHPINYYPSCWQPLLPPIVFDVEAFKIKDCPDNDIWPCEITICDPLIELCHDDNIDNNNIHDESGIFKRKAKTKRIPWEQL